MTNRSLTTTLGAAILAALLAACGAGGGSSLPPAGGGGSGGSGGSSSASAETAIAATNSLGTPLKDIDDDAAALAPQTTGLRPATGGSGTCTNGTEFFAPDKAGDPNSTETILFYDGACTQEARDAVRLFSSIGANSETVNRTMNLYAAGGSTPIAMRTEATTISNATFGANGFPQAANGFDRVSTGNLDIAGVKTLDGNHELVMLPASSGSNSYCSDSAGYNATGFVSLGETFGWNGGTSGTATRTVNGDGTVTWSATHAGTNFKGPIGTLGIATGTANTTCPIVTPMFTLMGGTTTGAYSIPITATYSSGMLVSLTITNATLGSGAMLNVVTNTALPASNPGYITGTIAKSGATTATFGTDAFGDGTLTVISSGATYTITDWHVVK